LSYFNLQLPEVDNSPDLDSGIVSDCSLQSQPGSEVQIKEEELPADKRAATKRSLRESVSEEEKEAPAKKPKETPTAAELPKENAG
jgi:hypothetical protein